MQQLDRTPLFLALAVSAAPALAQDPLLVLEEPIVLPVANSEGGFANSLSLGDGTLAIGAWGVNGQVHVFRRTPSGEFDFEKRLDEHTIWVAQYGQSLVARGDTVVVGARFESYVGAQDGAAYVYERSGGSWPLVARLTPTPEIAGENFGTSFDLDGDLLVIGANGYGTQGCRSYVFRRVAGSWQQEAVLPASSPWDQGWAVGCEGTTFVASDPAFGLGGAVQVFEDAGGGQWDLAQTLEPSDAAAQQHGHFFGHSLDLDGDVLAVGNPEWDLPNKGNTGAVYVFERTAGSWAEVAILEAPDPRAGAHVGQNVRLDGDLLLANGRVIVAPGTLADAVLIWRRGPQGWSFVRHVLSEVLQPHQTWSYVFDIQDRHLIAGAPQVGGGRAMPFELLEPVGTPYCTANPNSSGLPADLRAFGSSALAEDLLVLEASDLPPERFGYFLASQSAGFLPLFGGGQGNLCLGAPVYRFASDVLNSGAQGQVQFRVRQSGLPQGAHPAPGQTWYFQLWHRDFNPQLTSNASSGLALDYR